MYKSRTQKQKQSFVKYIKIITLIFFSSNKFNINILDSITYTKIKVNIIKYIIGLIHPNIISDLSLDKSKLI